MLRWKLPLRNASQHHVIDIDRAAENELGAEYMAMLNMEQRAVIDAVLESVNEVVDVEP